MSNLGEALWQRAFEEGYRQGFELGCKEGLEQAREATALLNNIRNVMDSLKITAEQAMDALQIPESEQAKYLALLNA